MRLAVALAAVLGAIAVACGASSDGEPTVGIVTTAITPRPTTATAQALASATTDAKDPASVLRAFVEALNNGNASGAKALFSADATWERGGQCPPGQCSGAARIGQEIDRDVAMKHRLEIASLDIAGDKVIAKIQLQTEQTRAGGIERVIQLFTARVAGGRIVEFRAENDLSDPVTAAFASQRGRQ